MIFEVLKPGIIVVQANNIPEGTGMRLGFLLGALSTLKDSEDALVIETKYLHNILQVQVQKELGMRGENITYVSPKQFQGLDKEYKHILFFNRFSTSSNIYKDIVRALW